MNRGDRRSFVILTTGRTGSTLLVSLLNSHPEIICHPEPFNPNGVFLTGSLPKMRGLGRLRAVFPVTFARFLLTTYGEPPIKGFKILAGQSPRAQDAIVRSPKVRKILLRRENLLAAYSSNLIAHATQQWHVRPGVPTRQTRVFFDEKNFERYVESINAHFDLLKNKLRAANQNWLELEYKDLLSTDAHRQVLSFIGAQDDAPLSSTMERRSPVMLADRFENWEDVARHLKSADRDAWLSDI